MVWSGECSEGDPVGGHKLKFRKLHLNIRNNIFTVRVVKHQNRFPYEKVCGISIFSYMENSTGHRPGGTDTH